MHRQTIRIRELNDHLRINHRGGEIVLTKAIQAKGADFIAELDDALTSIMFGKDCDANDEHDFGSVVVKGIVVSFRIDYYALDRKSASLNPADQTVTFRVMTIMLAEEV